MIVALLVAALAAAIAVVMVLRHRSSIMPQGWTAITAGKSYGARVETSGSFDFPLSPSSVHYVTRASPSLAGKVGVRLRYRISADQGVEIVPASEPGAPSIGPTLYLQRNGDDWSGHGKYETYRWWATFASPVPIAPGEHEVIAPFDQHWTAVMSSNSDDHRAAFLDALDHADRIGFTFGGGTGYGHGVLATGKARFELLEFEVW